MVKRYVVGGSPDLAPGETDDPVTNDKSWSASDFGPKDYVDQEYVDTHTEDVTEGVPWDSHEPS